MKILLLLVILVFCTFFVAAQTPTALQEADKISREAVKLFTQGKYDDAAPLAQKVIAIREKELGKTHVSVAQAWRNLAYIQLERKKNKEAEKAFSNALDILEKNQPLAPADEKTFAEILEVVALYEALDIDIIGAEKKLLRAVELREKVNGKDAPETANALFKLGQIYQFKGEFEKAAPPLVRALDIRTKKDGKLDAVASEYYRNADCALSKIEREDERKQLSERFFPKSQVGNEQNATIKGGIVNGKAIYLAKPNYPREARNARASGAVSVSVLIDETGNVIFACAVNGAKQLQRTTEIAAYQAKFSPTTLSGKPVKVSGIITYNYVP